MAAKKKPNRAGEPLHVYLPPELRDAFTAFAKANRRSITGEVIIALEKHLREHGAWPPPPAPPRPANGGSGSRK